jgi:glycerol-3-phosphate O-acyltransferase
MKLYKELTNITKKYGRANIKYAEPLSLNDYLQQYSTSHNLTVDKIKGDEKVLNKFIDDFGMEITYAHSDNLIIMTTSIVATVILMHRKGINNEQLLKRVIWIYEEIRARNGELNLGTTPTVPILEKCLTYLKDFIDNKRDILEPSISAKKGQASLLMLSYYRNNLIHLFIQEAQIACTVLGLSASNDNQNGVSIDLVYERFQFIQNLLSEEFILRKQIKSKEELIEKIKFMAERKFLNVDLANNSININLKDDGQSTALSFLFHMLLPYIESYWITLTFFTGPEAKEHQHDEDTLYNNIQWLTENLYTEGLVKYYESCTLE